MLTMTLSPQQEKTLAARWHQWIPWVCLAARQRGETPNLKREEIRFRTYAVTCLRRGMPWTTIRTNQLDDPRRTPEEFDALLDKVVFGRNKVLASHRVRHARGDAYRTLKRFKKGQNSHVTDRN